MTIASDHWIRGQCLGEPHYELYYDTDFKGVFPLEHFIYDKDEYNALKNLKPSERHEFKKLDSMVTVKCVETLPPNGKPLIYPFVENSCKTIDVGVGDQKRTLKCPSYGLSSFGYDIRVGRNFKRLKNLRLEQTKTRVAGVSTLALILPGVNTIVATAGDSVHKPEDLYEDIEADYIDILAGESILGVSVERLCMPANVTATCMAKSTLARMFLNASVTPIEAGWSGYVTLEITNLSPNIIRLYAGIGIMQLIYHIAEEPCMVSYSDRNGKYMNQPAIPVAGTF